MKLPRRYNYAEAYLTFRCPLNCEYCINDDSGKLERRRKEISGKEWVKGLNRIDFGNIPLTLGGGEPTQHADFYEILERLNMNKVDLLTNLEFDVEKFLDKTIPERFSQEENPAYKSIRVSFHPGQMDPDDLVRKVKRIQDEGYAIGIFGLNHPLNIEDNIQMSELARQNGIYFFIKDFLGEYRGHTFGFYKYPNAIKGGKKEVLCKTKELLIDPEGEIYRCHRDLYRKKHKVGSILDPNFKTDKLDRFRPCLNFGECNPCDVKLKTNRFLQKGNCQVEIVK